MIAWLGSLIGFAFHNSSFFPMEIDSASQLCNRVNTVLELPSANSSRPITITAPFDKTTIWTKTYGMCEPSNF